MNCFKNSNILLQNYKKNFIFPFQRSYRHELFNDAIARMQKAMIKTNVEIEKFRFLQEKVDKIVLEKQQEEVDYGEIPEEFKGQIISVIRKGFQKPFPPLFFDE